MLQRFLKLVGVRACSFVVELCYKCVNSLVMGRHLSSIRPLIVDMFYSAAVSLSECLG
jgi:hypothetical protein